MMDFKVGYMNNANHYSGLLQPKEWRSEYAPNFYANTRKKFTTVITQNPFEAMLTKRCVIYPKDVMALTGRSLRYCQALLSKIRKIFNKQPGHFVTIAEFSWFTGIPEAEIERHLQ
jgi:hypothetical protein